MSWFARSIANTLNFDKDDEDDATTAREPENAETQNDSDSSPVSPTRGVKDDLSELSKTLTRQFWGVASFLAPPPEPETKSDSDVPETEQDPILGIRGDFAEIGGRFRSGISRLSNNINVSEITKIASNFLQLESDDENEEMSGRKSFDFKGAVGVTEEVVSFAHDIAMHPETWLDFPLPDNDGDAVDFHMSDAQQEHALAVERLAPTLAALRIELCPGYMSENCFWKIYFVLVHPRLDKQDSLLLSTPQIVEARALLTHELKNRNTTPEDLSQRNSLSKEESALSRPEEPLSVPSPILSGNEHNVVSGLEIGTSTATATPGTGELAVERNEIKTVGHSVAEEKGVSQDKGKYLKSASSDNSEEKDEDDADDWLNEEEEASETGAAAGSTIQIDNDEDVSFSDLEEDDGDIPTNYRKSNYSSDKESRDWVQLGKSSPESSKDVDVKQSDKEKDSNDWLDVDDDIAVD